MLGKRELSSMLNLNCLRTSSRVFLRKESRMPSEGMTYECNLGSLVLDPEVALVLKAVSAAAGRRGNTRGQRSFGPLFYKTLDFREGRLLAQGPTVGLAVAFHHQAAFTEKG
ncbi:hypothetical protein DBR06_SOUSAS17610008 [Sousa chinensis]|nr:hypothetical protein DBR06_SOUSAS17610008 [Sousa chinensis]